MPAWPKASGSMISVDVGCVMTTTIVVLIDRVDAVHADLNVNGNVTRKGELEGGVEHTDNFFTFQSKHDGYGLILCARYCWWSL